MSARQCICNSFLCPTNVIISKINLYFTMLDCLSFVQCKSNLVSLDCNPRSGGSNLVSCSTESGGVSHKTSHSTGKVLIISFIPLALAIPLLVFQHLNLHISHSCKLLKRSHLFLLCLVHCISL